METGVARPISRLDPTPEAARRLRRLRGLAWFLDRSIPLGRWRVGVDPILGLLPGAGDWIGALLSVYVFYEGARLGLPSRVLTRMAGNILVDSVVGAVPVLGDLFDFAWQANTRNMQLIERHYRPDFRPRSLARIGLLVALFAAVLLALVAGLIFVAFRAIEAAFR